MIRIKRLAKSFIYALRGLGKIFLEEQNLQIQTIAAFLLIFASFLLKVDRMEWILLIIAIALVILMEIINSAVERVTDVLKPRINGYVKEIKDITAGAVLIASITAVAVGIIILGPRLLGLF